jgi:hypothetical protein
VLIEALAAGIVGTALLWLILQPLLFPGAVAVEPVEEPDAEETPRGIALIALREIDFDRATGKLSDEDYAELHARYSAAAIAVLDDEPVEVERDPIEEMIAARAALKAAGTCAVHGPRPAIETRFCSECGGLLSRQDRRWSA